MSALRTAIIVPTFNERENVEAAVRAVLGALSEASVLIVDDASPDGTGVIADRLRATDRRVHVLHRVKKDGLGGAYLDGFAWAIERGYELVGEFDADGSHPAASLPAMYAVMAQDPEVGLVVGSRWVTGGRVADWPRSRELLSRGGNAYARFALGITVRDATAGFRLYRAAVLRQCGLDCVRSRGYCFQVDLTVRVLAAGGVIREVPIVFRDRVVGESKMSAGIVLEAMWMVTVWGLLRAAGRPGRRLAARLALPIATLGARSRRPGPPSPSPSR